MREPPPEPMRKGGWIDRSQADDNAAYDRAIAAVISFRYQPTLPNPSSAPCNSTFTREIKILDDLISCRNGEFWSYCA
ncbi:MAG: hypothetical protein ACRD9Y_23750, partial [Blastocatellia bacterium]